MKKMYKPLMGIALLFVLGAAWFLHYMMGDSRGHVTEMAADALVDAAKTAASWTEDRTEYKISIHTLMGQGRPGAAVGSTLVVQATLSTRGAERRAAICASLPKVRDAINVLLADRFAQALERDRPVPDAELDSYDGRLKAALNRAIEEGIVEHVALSTHTALNNRDAGCTSPKAQKDGTTAGH
jgi:hypothetical protein